MRFRQCSTVTAIAALLLTAPAIAAADNGTCSELPRPRMNVRLTINSLRFAGASPVIRTVVQQVWGREGLELDWLSPTESPSWTGVDVWVVAQHEPVSFTDPMAIGSVLFSADEPAQIVRISIDAAVDWVRRGFARRHGVLEAKSDRFLIDDVKPQVELTLAYAVAHEIGHFVLADRGHANGGLMQAHLRSLVEMNRGSSAIRLDTRSQRRLAHRLESAARCGRQ